MVGKPELTQTVLWQEFGSKQSQAENVSVENLRKGFAIFSAKI